MLNGKSKKLIRDTHNFKPLTCTCHYTPLQNNMKKKFHTQHHFNHIKEYEVLFNFFIFERGRGVLEGTVLLKCSASEMINHSVIISEHNIIDCFTIFHSI